MDDIELFAKTDNGLTVKPGSEEPTMNDRHVEMTQFIVIKHTQYSSVSVDHEIPSISACQS